MVNINDVYQRVLFIANKEQRGYITPDEFNSYAAQAQLEIFEGYFIKQFQTMQAPMSEADYANISMNVEEKINEFHAQVSVSADSNGVYPYPTGQETPALPVFYRLTNVTVAGRICDEVMHNKLTYINLSPLTAPTVAQPVMVRRANGVQVYPSIPTTTDSNGNLLFPVVMDYLRRPVDPVWGFLTTVTNPDGTTTTIEPTYNAATSTDFELHPSDEQDLVYKILTLAGVAIKQPDVSSFGQGKDAQLQQTEG